MAPDWLTAWTCADRKVWTASVHIARRARNRRDDFYRKLAKQWAIEYEAVAFEKLDLKTAAVKVDERTGEKTDFAKKARAGRVVASLYKLDSFLRWSCEKWGTALLEHTEKTTQTCALCGADGLMEDDEDHQVLHCAGCGAVLDRKKNGAAIAWQWANEDREEKIAEYWRIKLEKERKAIDSKVIKTRKDAGRTAVEKSGKEQQCTLVRLAEALNLACIFDVMTVSSMVCLSQWAKN